MTRRGNVIALMIMGIQLIRKSDWLVAMVWPPGAVRVTFRVWGPGLGSQVERISRGVV